VAVLLDKQYWHTHKPFERLSSSSYHHHWHFLSGLNSKNYCKDHCSGWEIMTRKRKCHSKSNSYVAAAEQVCLQPVLEHRQRRGRRNIAWQAIPHLCSSNRKGTRISRVSSWFCTLMKALSNYIATARTRRTLTKYQIEIRSVFIPVRYVWRLIESLCNNNDNHNGSLLS